MLPNMGRQNFHNTVDGLPTVRSWFMGIPPFTPQIVLFAELSYSFLCNL